MLPVIVQRDMSLAFKMSRTRSTSILCMYTDGYRGGRSNGLGHIAVIFSQVSQVSSSASWPGHSEEMLHPTGLESGSPELNRSVLICSVRMGCDLGVLDTD